MSYKINERLSFTDEGSLSITTPSSFGGTYLVSYLDIATFVKWYTQGPCIMGYRPVPNRVAFGCIDFTAQEIEQVIDAFKQERWKQPIEKEYTIGARFEWGHTEYMYANVDWRSYNLINLKTGERMFTNSIEKDHITLKELNSHSSISGIEPKE